MFSFGWIRQIFAHELVRGGLDRALKRVQELLAEDPRKDVVTTLFALEAVNSEAGKYFWRRLEWAALHAQPDYENEVVRALGRLLPRKADGSVDRATAIERFEHIARTCDDNKFATLVNAMKHDPATQVAHQFLKTLAGALGDAGRTLDSGSIGTSVKQWSARQRERADKKWRI